MSQIINAGSQETLKNVEQKQNNGPSVCLIGKPQLSGSIPPLNQNSNVHAISYQQPKTEQKPIHLNQKMRQETQTIVSTTEGHSDSESSQNQVKRSQLTLIKKASYPQVVGTLEMIRQGQYSRNRVYLYGWMKKQCQKFKLQYETFANSVALMEEYYKYLPFEKEKFIMTALCFIIISSKALETKVLFTSTVANANNFNYAQMLKVEEDIIVFFQFLLTSYNFVAVVCEYMRRWDSEMYALGANSKGYLFFEERKESYIQYMEVMFLSESHMRHQGSLLQSSIKKIFNCVLNNQRNEEIGIIIERIFAEPCPQASKQLLFSYDIKSEQIEVNFDEWRKEFTEKSQPSLQIKFEQRKNYNSYPQFRCMLLP